MKAISRASRNHIFKVCVALAMVASVTGCSWFRKKPEPVKYEATSAPPAQPNAAVPQPAPATNTSQLLVAPTSVGKIASVNLQGKFVVLQFPIGQVPPADTRMVVYHGDAKTGEVKITGPTQDDLTVADIVLGTVQVNDEVRAN